MRRSAVGGKRTAQRLQGTGTAVPCRAGSSCHSCTQLRHAAQPNAHQQLVQRVLPLVVAARKAAAAARPADGVNLVCGHGQGVRAVLVIGDCKW